MMKKFACLFFGLLLTSCAQEIEDSRRSLKLVEEIRSCNKFGFCFQCFAGCKIQTGPFCPGTKRVLVEYVEVKYHYDNDPIFKWRVEGVVITDGECQ